MSAEPVTPVHQDDNGNARCWSCGSSNARDRMVHLGEHPEAHLCLRCAHDVHHQAWLIEDTEKPGPAAVARDQFRALRAEVMGRGWHQNKRIGGILRWLGKYLP